MKPLKFEKLSPRVQELLATSASNFSGSAIAIASKQLQEEKVKKEAERTLTVLRNADRILQMKAQVLRDIRAREKAALKDLKKVDAAFVQFSKDGNVEKFAKNADIPVSTLTVA